MRCPSPWQPPAPPASAAPLDPRQPERGTRDAHSLFWPGKKVGAGRRWRCPRGSGRLWLLALPALRGRCALCAGQGAGPRAGPAGICLLRPVRVCGAALRCAGRVQHGSGCRAGQHEEGRRNEREDSLEALESVFTGGVSGPLFLKKQVIFQVQLQQAAFSLPM